jgi:hypothetical protein
MFSVKYYFLVWYGNLELRNLVQKLAVQTVAVVRQVVKTGK